MGNIAALNSKKARFCTHLFKEVLNRYGLNPVLDLEPKPNFSQVRTVTAINHCREVPQHCQKGGLKDRI